MYEFLCEFCNWEGTNPTLDPHLIPFCPQCGKPVEFKAIVEMKRKRRPTAG